MGRENNGVDQNCVHVIFTEKSGVNLTVAAAAGGGGGSPWVGGGAEVRHRGRRSDRRV